MNYSKFIYYKKKKRRNYKRFIGSADISLPRFLSDCFNTSFGSWSQIFLKAMTFNSVRCAGKIKCPVKIIFGKKDSFFPIIYNLKYNALFKKAEIEIVDSNHIITLNNPKELARAIEGFLTNCAHHHRDE